MSREFSKIRESLAPWSDIRQLLRGGERGQLVPVVIPKDRRGYAWVSLLLLALYLAGTATLGPGWLRPLAGGAAVLVLVIAAIWLWRRAIIEIEEGTTGVRSRWGAITGTLSPGRHYL